MPSSSCLSRVVTFVGCLMIPALASAQQPLQFNVPYSCQDGYTRIISRCEKNARGGEVCFWREGKNGQFDSERYNVRAQMDGWLAMCKAPPAQPAAAAPAAQSPAAPQATAPPPMPVARPGQSLNPSYLAGMPSPDAVRQKIQGSNAVDTLARQVAVLNRLPRVISDRMRLAPERGFNLTPDEIQVANAYSLTSYQLSQGYMKSATPEAVKTFQQMVAGYEGDPALNDQMMGLLSAATLAEYRRVDRLASERAQARIDQQKRENEQAQALPATPAAGGARPMYNDPGTVQMRRCLELGGGTAECLGSGLKTGFLDLVGGPSAELLRLADSVGRASGVRIGGTFAAAGGVTMAFSEGTVNFPRAASSNLRHGPTPSRNAERSCRSRSRTSRNRWWFCSSRTMCSRGLRPSRSRGKSLPAIDRCTWSSAGSSIIFPFLGADITCRSRFTKRGL